MAVMVAGICTSVRCPARADDLKLADLWHDRESYLSDFARSAMPFPKPLPEIKLEDLAVVAFVQDDGDQRVLHAVSVPVKPARP